MVHRRPLRWIGAAAVRLPCDGAGGAADATWSPVSRVPCVAPTAMPPGRCPQRRRNGSGPTARCRASGTGEAPRRGGSPSCSSSPPRSPSARWRGSEGPCGPRRLGPHGRSHGRGRSRARQHKTVQHASRQVPATFAMVVAGRTYGTRSSTAVTRTSRRPSWKLDTDSPPPDRPPATGARRYGGRGQPGAGVQPVRPWPRDSAGPLHGDRRRQGGPRRALSPGGIGSSNRQASAIARSGAGRAIPRRVGRLWNSRTTSCPRHDPDWANPSIAYGKPKNSLRWVPLSRPARRRA